MSTMSASAPRVVSWPRIRITAAAIAAWTRPFRLFVMIIATKNVARLHNGQAFLLATEGDTFENSLRDFRELPEGRRLIEQRPDSVAMLCDRDALLRCPPGSLGRSYAEFMATHGLEEEYYTLSPIVTALKSSGGDVHRWYRARIEQSHDLRHLLADYPPDYFGEVCLLAFRAGQSGHFGAYCLALLGCIHPLVRRRGVLEAYRRGRRAQLVDLLAWEEQLAQPLADVRASLDLVPTTRFPRPSFPEAYRTPTAPGIDLIDTFGPMSGMHAALNEVGVGMPCGIVARFRDTTPAAVDAAIGVAAAHFPVLRSRLAWAASRPVLLPLDGWRQADARTSAISLGFKAEADGAVWRYALVVDGADVRFSAVWAHAAADGRSMLHFVTTVAAALGASPPPLRAPKRPRPVAKISLARWLPRFLVERHLPYVRMVGEPDAPGVSWTVLPRASADAALAVAGAEGGGFAAWLAAAASMAFCAQQRGVLDGRVSLNLLVARDDLSCVGGFGFAAGSLLLPVKLDGKSTMRSVAGRIFARQTVMMAQGWDEHLERFISRKPARHRWFAVMAARGAPAPTLSVSWKGVYAGDSGVADVACFAAASVAHVSAHVDANGLSISVASCQSPAAREDLLRRIAGLIDPCPIERVLTL